MKLEIWPRYMLQKCKVNVLFIETYFCSFSFYKIIAERVKTNVWDIKIEDIWLN